MIALIKPRNSSNIVFVYYIDLLCWENTERYSVGLVHLQIDEPVSDFCYFSALREENQLKYDYFMLIYENCALLQQRLYTCISTYESQLQGTIHTVKRAAA